MTKVSTDTELVGVETCIRSGTLQGISLQYSDKGHLWNATVVGMMIGTQNMRGTCDTLNLITRIQSITAYWTRVIDDDSQVLAAITYETEGNVK